MTTVNSVTPSDSVAAFSNMLRCAFSTIAFLRGFCSADSFRNVQIGGMTFKRIIPGPQEDAAEANKIFEWVEGVIDAFKEGYLQQVSLQAYSASASPRRELLEVYGFTVTKGAGGIPIIGAKCLQNCAATQTQKEVLCISSQPLPFPTEDSGNGNSSLLPSPQPFTKEQLRSVIATMLCDLVVALESMPTPDTERCIGMRITYNEDVTPPDYEPRHFAPVSRQQVLSDIARERRLSVARHCDGTSGYHNFDMGVMYQPPVVAQCDDEEFSDGDATQASQELNSADFQEEENHDATHNRCNPNSSAAPWVHQTCDSSSATEHRVAQGLHRGGVLGYSCTAA